MKERAKNNKYLAIIPARGGSKRLPRKNILSLAGKPLIAWSIEAALGCDEIDTVVVSSDDDEILAVASQYPVELVKRPKHFATDTAVSFSAVQHVLERYVGYKYTVLLQPTSPLRRSEHISEAIKLLKKKKAAAVISVCQTEHNPLWSNELPADGSMEQFMNENILNLRSQDLPTYYRLNGAIYISETTELLIRKSFFLKENIYAYIMEQENSIDIDTKSDFDMVNCLFKSR